MDKLRKKPKDEGGEVVVEESESPLPEPKRFPERLVRT
jgi:hypothetical protein